MWNALRSRWHMLAALPLLCVGFAPLRAAAAPNTTVSLNGVALDSSYSVLLATKGVGMPRLIGPALDDASDINNLLRFPPGFIPPTVGNSAHNAPSTTVTPGKPTTPPTFQSPYLDPSGTTLPWDASGANGSGGSPFASPNSPPWAQRGGASMSPPWAQPGGAGGMAPPWAQPGGATAIAPPWAQPGGAGGMASPWAQPGGAGGMAPPWAQQGGAGFRGGLPTLGGPSTATSTQKIKGHSKYLAWSYKKDGYRMYIILDRQKGLVSAVVLWLTNTTKFTKPITPTSITFGSSVSDIINVYNYPDYSTKVGSSLLYYYPDKDITFSIDTATRKVIGIAIANKSLTAILKNLSDDAVPTTKTNPTAPTRNTLPFAGGGMHGSPFGGGGMHGSPFGGPPGGLPGNAGNLPMFPH